MHRQRRAKSGFDAEHPDLFVHGQPDIGSGCFAAVDLSAALPERLIQWIECLPVPSGRLAGQRFELYPWQREIVRSLYGPDGPRVRQAVISIPRKNGKTGLAACLTLAHLAMDGLSVPHGEVYSVGGDRAQAALLHRVMAAIIREVPALSTRLKVLSGDKTIHHMGNHSVYKALSAEVSTKHGLSASFIVCDEVAQWPKRDLWDVMITSMGAHKNPLCIAISTQAPVDAHLFSELVDYALGVEAGTIPDPDFWGRVWAAPPDADPWDPEVWAACNPGLGTIRGEKDLRALALQCANIPAREPAFRNLYLNQRISRSPGFLPVQAWRECEGAPEFDGPCVVGVDLSSTTDLSAVAAYWPVTGAVRCWIWVPVGAMRAEGARVPYEAWSRLWEEVTVCDGVVDRRAVVRQVGRLSDEYDVVAVAYDRWQISEFLRLVEEEGIWIPELEEFGQGYRSMAPAVDLLEEAVLSGRMVHRGEGYLTWSFSNLAIKSDDAGNRKFSKKESTGRIDPMVAVTMAVGAAATVDHAVSTAIGPLAVTV